jgi:hypothetical protein
MKDTLDFNLAMADARKKAAGMFSGIGLYGYGTVSLLGADGRLKDIESFANKITTAGDQYYATRAIAGVSPAAAADATKMSGMKLGTGTTAAAKSGAGAALVTYISGSNNPFDASFPTAAAVGGDSGWNATYKTTWAAGDVTNSAITEAVIVNDAGTDLTSTSANTAARVVFAAKNKTVDDTLVITWVHTFLGA